MTDRRSLLNSVEQILNEIDNIDEETLRVKNRVRKLKATLLDNPKDTGSGDNDPS